MLLFYYFDTIHTKPRASEVYKCYYSVPRQTEGRVYSFFCKTLTFLRPSVQVVALHSCACKQSPESDSHGSNASKHI